MTSGATLGACEGERYHDICTDPLTCRACAIWQQAGESDAEWKARLRAWANYETPTCRNGHLWTDDTLRFTTEGFRYCRECKRAAATRSAPSVRTEVAS